ncbi:hypothetical protein EMGBS15_17250 [Filimonas sp.]|nr:hypothetical protein EMGBS15_17250 [Filimonas sp.]
MPALLCSRSIQEVYRETARDATNVKVKKISQLQAMHGRQNGIPSFALKNNA